jgi:hypothetical protein
MIEIIIVEDVDNHLLVNMAGTRQSLFERARAYPHPPRATRSEVADIDGEDEENAGIDTEELE